MKTNTFKARLKEKQQIGLWLSLGSAASAEILAHSGADWLLIDMEHSPNEIATVLDQLRAVGEDSEVIVRPPNADQTVTKRLLDTGVRSIMFPMIDTAEQARQAVSWTRYPPKGTRGISNVVRATGYGRHAASYLEAEDARICVIVQAETPTALANIEEIAQVEGVDAIFIGPGDLAASMGFPGQGASALAVADAIHAALKRINATGCGAGVLGYGEKAAGGFFSQGADFVAVGADTWLLAQQSTSLVERVKARLGEQGTS